MFRKKPTSRVTAHHSVSALGPLGVFLHPSARSKSFPGTPHDLGVPIRCSHRTFLPRTEARRGRREQRQTARIEIQEGQDSQQGAFDILVEDTNNVLMERLNLNVPAETRAKIRRIARRRQLKEAEAARELLIEAVEREERDEFYRRFEQAQTPELRERLFAITHALETLGGRSR